MKTTKIKLIIFPGNFLPNTGGLETHVDEFVKFLPKNKYEITIFAPNANKAKEKEIIHKNVKVIRYPAVYAVSNFPIPKFWTIKFWDMFFSLYHNKYDITMTRTRFFTNSAIGCFFAKFRIRPLKLVHVEHGSEYVMLESKLKSTIARIYDETIGRLVFLSSDKTIAISQVSKKFVCRNFVNCKKKYVPIIKRGIDYEEFDKIKENEELKNKFKNKTIITFVGRLYKWKGVENSIKAYKSLPEEIRKKAVFVIVGYGEDFERLKVVADNFLGDGIYFLGKKSFEQAISIMKIADIYVHSSYPGGALSNSLMQAMHSKCACIVSPNEGASELIKNNDNGILLKGNSQKQIKDALEKLLPNKKLIKKYSVEANKHIIKNYHWKKAIENYDKEFEELIYNN